MKKFLYLLVLISGIALINNSCRNEGEWKSLFNKKDLDNWDTYFGRSLGASFDSLALTRSIENIYSVVEMDGENVIRISGEVFASLATREDFENYHLRMVFKWGEQVSSSRNSGLLYHSFGEFGVAFETWMPNIELQLMHQNLGDTYLMANTSCEAAAVKDDGKNQFIYTPGADLIAFGEHANGRSIRKRQDMEKPLGEWNTVELYCFGRTTVHVINGITVMVNENTGIFENNVVKPLTAGKIQVQSEGAELFVKSIDIRTITKLPKGILPD